MTNHRDVLRRHAAELLNKPGVYAVGLGEKVSQGKKTGKKALVCSIAKKKPVAQLKKEELIPLDVEGILTDIVEIGDRPRALPAWQDKQRPLVPGVSGGHYAITAGTLGAIVEVDGEAMILSNNHVLANENNARLGDSIIQPGDYDGGSVLDKVAELYDYIPLTFTHQTEPTPPPGEEPPAPEPDPEPEPDPTPPPPPPEDDEEEDSDCFVANLLAGVLNKVSSAFGRSTRLKPVKKVAKKSVTAQVILNRVDAALARIEDDITYKVNYLTYSPGVKGVNELAGPGTFVKKLGRTTGYTEGQIVQTDVIVDVAYDGGLCRFEDQIMIESNGENSFSAGGDSGSLILDSNDNAVALLFAGNDLTTFGNPIFNVMQELKITRFIGDNE